MANELKHGSVGTELTQAEWEAIGTHVFNSQATGDIVYASSSSQLSRLGVGSNTNVLTLASGIPSWAAPAAAAAGSLTGSTLASGVTASSLTSVGTIATGVWQGTDVGVAYGGTGVSTLTDGGILLGSGASAITAMAVLTDGQMIVGNGSTDPVAESGATLRTSIGVGTGDSPQFTDLTLTDDLTLNSDSAVFNMGDGNDFTITHDGTTGATIAGNPIIVDSGAQIELDSATGIITFEDGGTEVLRFTEGNSGDVTVKLVTNAKDLIFTDNGDATGLTIKDGAAGIVVPGEVMTTKISYTDGDDAITIADGGGITAAAGITSTAAANSFGAPSFSGDASLTDNTKVTLGTGGDADIYYDATDMVINTRVAGSGDLVTHSQLVWGTGVAVTAADYSIGRDADGTNQLHFNVPSGAGYEFSVADGAKFIVKTNGALQVYGGGAVGDLDFAWTFDTNTGFYRSDPDRVNMVAGGVSVAGWGAMGLNTAGIFTARSTTNPTRAISLFNGTAPVGTLADGVTLYSASGELLVMDAAGNATTLS